MEHSFILKADTRSASQIEGSFLELYKLMKSPKLFV
jgi:hypothetical protein